MMSQTKSRAVMDKSPNNGKASQINIKDLFVKDMASMSLEEKILAGAFKPFA
jgi:hypothetical protein